MRQSWTRKFMLIPIITNYIIDSWTLHFCKTDIENQYQVIQGCFSIANVFFMFFRPHELNLTFPQANLFTKQNGMIVFNGVWLLNSIEHNLIDWVRWVLFVQLSSTDSEIEFTQRLVFDFVWLPNSIKLKWTQSADWVPSSLISGFDWLYAET